MKQIRLISTSTVRPENDHNHYNEFTNRRIELTPCDLQLLQVDPIQKGLLFHKPQNGNFNIQHLKTTLSHTLNTFFPLAGRLAMTENDDATVSFHIDCDGSGALFLHAALDGVTVADVLHPVYISDVVVNFFPMNGVPNYEGVSKPLLAVQVTELVDGVFVGCTMNHVVLDGTSFWQFFNTWSEISRSGEGGGGGGVSSHIPPLYFGREFLDNNNINLPIRILFKPEYFAKNPNKPPSLKQRMFHFSKENIAKLKAKANEEMGTAKISSLQAILAHLFVSITRNRNLKPDEAVTYKVIVGLRSRTDPPLPERYFGNAVLFGSVGATAGEVLEKGFGWAAWQMNRMVASQTSEEVNKFLKDWAQNPKIVSQFRGSHDLGNGRLITGSSPRFDVFGNDFGWGKPIAVRSGPGNKFDGKLTVFPGAEEGSIDFEACLGSQTLQRLESDAEFFDVL